MFFQPGGQIFIMLLVVVIRRQVNNRQRLSFQRIALINEPEIFL
jgi:hypothetical protein